MVKGQLVLDAEEPTWTIPETVTKNRRRHVVPLSRLAVRLLRIAMARNGNEGLLFPSPDGAGPVKKPALPMAMTLLFRKYLASLQAATPHDLRRTAATGMRRIGILPVVVSMILNHKHQDVTGRHYDHHDGLDERRDALARWAQHLERVLGHL